MSRLFHTLSLLLVVLRLAAQMPEWHNAASRKMHYPQDAWYTGYVEGQQKNGESIEDALSRLKNAARAELVSSIRTTVEQNISNRLESELRQSTSDFDEQGRETFVNETSISSGIRDIPGLQVEVYRHPQDGTIAAFAYMRRTTLGNQLIKRITLGVSKAESALEQTQTILDEGHKSEARQMAEKGLQQLTELEEAQNLLSIVDETADEERLQYTATKTLQKQLEALATQLKNAITVYIDCQADLFGEQYVAFIGQIKGELAQMDVSFVNSPELSEWAVYISASAREYNSIQFGNVTTYAVYAEADVVVEKNGKRIYEKQLTSKKGVHTNGFDEAAREAYETLIPLIRSVIQEQIR